MPQTSTDLCNLALAKIGHDQITSLDDNTSRAVLCKRLYEPTRDSVFRDHPWRCIQKRALLAQDGVAPAWGYIRSYTIPSDSLRVNEVDLDEDGTPWTLEGRKILTDAALVGIRYTRREDDVSFYDGLLADAISQQIGRAHV